MAITTSTFTTGGSGSAHSGTTVDFVWNDGGGVQVGDIIIIMMAMDPTNAVITFSKLSGSCTISSFATNIVSDNGAAHLVVSYCTVTGAGSITLRASSDQTINNAVALAQGYRGASGVGQNVTNSGSGQDVSVTMTTAGSGSWAVMCATDQQNLVMASGTNGVTEESGTVFGGSGISAWLGSNESPLSPSTNITVHATQDTSPTSWSAVGLELLGPVSADGAGQIAAAAAVTVSAPAEAAAGSITAAASTVVTGPPPAPIQAFGELEGPPIPGAPWVVYLPIGYAYSAPPPATPPPVVPPPPSPPTLGEFVGPPIPGAPWADLLPGQDDWAYYSFTLPVPSPHPPGPAARNIVPIIPRYNSKASDKDRQDRLQRITDMVGQIVNSLRGTGELFQDDIVSWKLGYVPDQAHSWNGPPPATVREALDRIALLLRNLNGGNGP